MNKNPETITDILFAQSDKALKAEIDKAASQFSNIINNGNISLYSYELRELKTEAHVNGYTMLERMKQIAFDGLRDSRRKQAVSEFMGRFEELSGQIEFMRNQSS